MVSAAADTPGSWPLSGSQLLARKSGRGLAPGKGRDPSHTCLFQLQRIGQSSRALVQHQGDAVSSDLVALEQGYDALVMP